MSDKELISRGAECVFGNLYLKRELVGIYRNGQFIITPEGAQELDNVIEAEVVEVPAKPKGKGKWVFANGNVVEGIYSQTKRPEDVADDIKLSWKTTSDITAVA